MHTHTHCTIDSNGQSINSTVCKDLSSICIDDNSLAAYRVTLVKEVHYKVGYLEVCIDFFPSFFAYIPPILPHFIIVIKSYTHHIIQPMTFI